jgi:hypothetical protein
MTGLLVRRVFAPTLDVALRLQPDTRQVVVVGGTSEFDRNLQAAARREFQPFERRLSFTYLTDLPMKDLLTAVSSVSPRKVILYVSLFRDGAGLTFVPHDAVSRISVASSAPVYVFVDHSIWAFAPLADISTALNYTARPAPSSASGCSAASYPRPFLSVRCWATGTCSMSGR